MIQCRSHIFLFNGNDNLFYCIHNYCISSMSLTCTIVCVEQLWTITGTVSSPYEVLMSEQNWLLGENAEYMRSCKNVPARITNGQETIMYPHRYIIVQHEQYYTVAFFTSVVFLTHNQNKDCALVSEFINLNQYYFSQVMIVACFVCWAYNYNRAEKYTVQIQTQQTTLSNIMQ